MEGSNYEINKKLISLAIAMVVALNFSAFSIIKIFSHETMLDVSYDDCVNNKDADEIDETWYILNRYNSEDNESYCSHIDHEMQTIKYYFEPTSPDGTYRWTTDLGTAFNANLLKRAYANSLKKWNNVYFYSYDESGNITKHKVINIIEGTATDHNLSIYPYRLVVSVDNEGNSKTSTATTKSISATSDTIETVGNTEHRHYIEWEMKISVSHFYVNGNVSQSQVDSRLERVGAHEMGHVLGLRDVDSYCSAEDQTNHHHEILMGYGSPIEARAQDITYKDIAGVAITRGFHTDNDHKWLYCGVQGDGTHKLLCSICNGVIYADNLSDYTYELYGTCNNNHELSSNNMMAVASYGSSDYYKCKYCKYVAPFSSLVSQNYSVTSYTNENYHQYVNNVNGLSYTFFEEHNPSDNGCSVCHYGHSHVYGSYIYSTTSTHTAACTLCYHINSQRHYIRSSDIVNGRYATCLGCNTLLDLNRDMATINSSQIIYTTENGSYILPNGIVVLSDLDIEAYLNGTLQFNVGNGNHQTQ